MATVTERLAFLLTLDASGAVKGFRDVGATAEKELKRAESSMDRVAGNMVRVGTGMAGSGVLAAVALSKLGDAAGDLNESLSKSNVIFGDAAGEVARFGDSADTAFGLSKRAAVDAAASFGTLFTNIGKSSSEAASMSIEMTKLAGDLASFSNTSPEDAVLALGAALRGEAEPIRRYGVLLDDATLKQRALTLGIYDGAGALLPAQRAQAAYAEILAQTSKQQGDFARTSDSLANQQRILAAELANLKAGIGEGVAPAMRQLVGIANETVGGLNSLHPAVREGIGTFAAYGAVGLTVVGAMSAVAGQALKLRDRFTTVTGEGDNASRSLNGLGKAAVGVSAGLTAIAATQATLTVLNEIGDAAGKAERGLQQLLIASKQQSAPDFVAAFAEMAKVEDKTLRLSHVWEDYGKTIKITGSSASRPIEDIDRAFDKTLKTSQTAAAGLLKAWREQNEALDHSSSQYKDNAELIDRYQKRLDLASGATSALAADTNALGGAADGTAGSVTELGKALDYAAEAAKSTDSRIAALKSSTFDLPDAQRAVEEGWSAIDDAAQGAGGATRDVEADMRRARNAAESLTDAQESLAEAEKRLEEVKKGPAARTVSDAELRLREARVGVERAAASSAAAEKKLADLRATGKASGSEIQDAELGVEEARIRQRRASDELRDAQQNLTDVRNIGREGSKELAEAEDQVAAAQKRVRDATEAAADAQKASQPAGAAHRDTQQQIADAVAQQEKNIWATVEAMKAQGKSQTEIDGFIEASKKKLDEYAGKYQSVRGEVDLFKKSLDELNVTVSGIANSAGNNLVPPAGVAQGIYDNLTSGATSRSSANAAEQRLVARVVVPLMLPDGRELARALIEVDRGYN